MSKLLDLHRKAARVSKVAEPAVESLSVSVEKITFLGCVLMFLIPIPLTLPIYLAYNILMESREKESKNAVPGTVTNKKVLAMYSANGKPVGNPEAALNSTVSKIISFLKEYETATSAFFTFREKAYSNLESHKKEDHAAIGKLVNTLAKEAHEKLPSIVMESWANKEFLGDVTLVQKGKNGSVFEYDNTGTAVKGELDNLTAEEIIALSKIQTNLAKELDSSVKAFKTKMNHFKDAPDPDMAFLGMGVDAGGDHVLLQALFGSAHDIKPYLDALAHLSRYVDDINHATEAYIKASVK